LHQDNVLDEALARLPAGDRAALHEWDQTLSTMPARMKFIDRLVADSRTVALNHTAGLSTPQQVQMVLFSLLSLMDTPDAYREPLKRLIRSRKRALYEEIGIACDEKDANQVDYYSIIDM